MNFFEKLIKKENFWPLLVVFILGMLAGRSLIFQSGYFNMHDDLQMMRQLQMEKCFSDNQIPCRWVPDMGYGYGFPLFNFYPPLPYLIGQVFRILSFSFIDTAKLTFALSFIVSGFTMYYLAKEFFGKWGGVVSSAFYIWAPYHSVDVYVRGAMNEAWALAWFPLILWCGYRLIVEKKKSSSWIVALSLSWVALLLSHNLMVMIFTPVFAFWCLMIWLKDKNIKKVFHLVISGLFALILAAFFTLPAIFEQNFIHVDTLTQGYYEYIAHYATIGQLIISRFWGYGPSIWGPKDGMPFQLGHLHWILSLVTMALSTIFIYKHKKFESYFKFTFFAIAFAWFASFMTHQNSTVIWQKIHPMAFVQFPWRFLALAILGFSLASGANVKLISKKYLDLTTFGLISILLILNWNYFVPQGGKMGPLTDKEKFEGTAWNLQRTAGIFDYLPNTAELNPKDPQTSLVDAINGTAQFSGQSQGTNWVKFDVDANTDLTARINIFQFPNWVIKVDGLVVEGSVPKDEKYGRIYVQIPKGKHSSKMDLMNTKIREYANFTSLVGWLVLLPLFWLNKKKLDEKLS